MNIFANMYHVGMAVTDIDAAAAKLGLDLNIEWAPIKTFDPLPFWTPERGMHDVTVKATYSRQGPQHLELVWCPNSPFYDPNNHPDARHIGVWADDLAAEVERLRAQNWQLLAAAGAPEDGYGILAYLRPPFPAMIVELVSPILKPIFAEWISEV